MKLKIAIVFTLLLLVGIAVVVWAASSPNTNKSTIYVKTGFTPDSVYKQLYKAGTLKNSSSFNFIKYFANLEKVFPGKYEIAADLSNRELLNVFQYGLQTEVSFRFGSNVLPSELFALLGQKYESDSQAFAKAIYNNEKLQALGLDSISVLALFWADTYKFKWSVNPDRIVDFFINDQQKFWNPERFSLLSKSGLHSSKEAYILATIIEKEAVKSEELPIIAGVYLNRLQIGMRLQADPTVKYAAGITSMQRVYGILDTESPFNTYLYKGLPPGPIGVATKEGVDAVLNYQEHNYLYFCAKDDLSGYHTFSTNFKDHQMAAIRYRKSLDKRGIKAEAEK